MPVKPVVFMGNEIRTPPLSAEARAEAGRLLRILQDGDLLSMPLSRPMPSILSGCHELRIRDASHNWRIMYYLAADAIIVLDVFAKKTQATPEAVVNKCRRLVAAYNANLETD